MDNYSCDISGSAKYFLTHRYIEAQMFNFRNRTIVHDYLEFLLIGKFVENGNLAVRKTQ